MLTEQEVFDKVVAGMAAQNWEKSVDSNDSCQFRGPNGLKCAVGQILPDHLVKEAQQEGFAGILNKIPGMNAHHHYWLLDNLMNAHDESYGADEMKYLFRNVATKFNLDHSHVQ